MIDTLYLPINQGAAIVSINSASLQMDLSDHGRSLAPVVHATGRMWRDGPTR